MKIINSIYERIEADGLDSLTDAERYYFAIYWLEGEVSNGGFEEFFSNSTGEFAHDALEGLQAVGATQMTRLLQSAINLFPNGVVPEDREERNRLLDQFTEAQVNELDQLTRDFHGYPDDLYLLTEAYTQANDDQFLGPSTLLELWKARRVRGVETRPSYIDPAKLEQITEEDARVSSRWCPECGQPCPWYRIECKRCGYPIGRERKSV